MISKGAAPNRDPSWYSEELTFATSTNCGCLGCIIFFNGSAFALTPANRRIGVSQQLNAERIIIYTYIYIFKECIISSFTFIQKYNVAAHHLRLSCFQFTPTSFDAKPVPFLLRSNFVNTHSFHESVTNSEDNFSTDSSYCNAHRLQNCHFFILESILSEQQFLILY